MNTSYRCQSMSRTGRCKRMTKDASKKCFQHKHSDEVGQINQEPEQPIVQQIDTSTSVRCEGITRSGSQCSKMTNNTNKRCHLHKQSVTSHVTDVLLAFNAPGVVRVPVPVPVPGPNTESVTNTVRRERRSTRSSMVETLETIQNQVRVIENLARSRLIDITNDDSDSGQETTNVRERSDQKKEKGARIRKKKNDKMEKEEKHSHRNSSDKTEDCCVCYDPVPESEFLECEHPVCKSCIGQLRDTRCPMCRAEIKSKNISEKEKKKMIRRRQEDHRNRNNELFHHYMQNQNYQPPQILPLDSVHTFIAQFSL